MKKIRITELRKMKSIEIEKNLNAWHKFEPRSVLISVAELSKRKYELSDSTKSNLSVFCEKYNHPSIDEFVTRYVIEDDYFAVYRNRIEEFDNIPSKQFTQKEILLAIMGLVMVILSRSGLFMQEVSKKSALGWNITGFREEITWITYPLLAIGIGLIIYAFLPFIKSLSKN